MQQSNSEEAQAMPAYETHQILNQPPEFSSNLYLSDNALQSAVSQFGGSWGNEALRDYGKLALETMMSDGMRANVNKPQFRSHDRFGQRINQVDFDPAYHQIMAHAIEAGLPSLPWQDSREGAHVVRAALVYLHNQGECGTTCPTTMTFAATPALHHQPDIAERWIPLVTARQYDGRNIPWYDKPGVTMGMAMTEKQGGSDVRANQSTAKPVGKPGGGQLYRLTGHKWFCSAPMSDGFLVLAQTDVGLGCFLMPRWTENGVLNHFQIQRLKDKLGNWSNASSEIEFRDAEAWLIGEEGRGVNTIIEMVSLTRYDCMLGSASLMRQAVAQALHHCAHRDAFGKRLNQHALMQNVLADMVVESEAAMWQTFRLSAALDKPEDESEQLLTRLSTPVGKFWICKRTPQLVYECMECLGGSGYVEESTLPRLYRESPLNSIWEGCGNIQSLDILRAMEKSPEASDVLFNEIDLSRGADKQLDNFVDALKSDIHSRNFTQGAARSLTSRMARAMQASLMIRNASDAAANYFLATRIQKEHGVYGAHDAPELATQIIDDSLAL